jgi:hypothetical protein
MSKLGSGQQRKGGNAQNLRNIMFVSRRHVNVQEAAAKRRLAVAQKGLLSINRDRPHTRQ